MIHSTRKYYNSYEVKTDTAICGFPNHEENFIIDSNSYDKIKDYPWYLSDEKWGKYVKGFVI